MYDEIMALMISASRHAGLNMSHKKQNRWNFWISGGGATLSFTLNNNVFIPAISGVVKTTFDHFYNTCPSDVYDWVKHYIKVYLEKVKEYHMTQEDKKELKCYEDYMQKYYAEQRHIDEDRDASFAAVVEEHRREHEEFLTEEELDMMYPQPSIDIKPEEPVVYTKKRKSRKSQEPIPGQLSLFDNE